MSFICQNCKKTIPPGIASERVVVETRPKIYVEKAKDKNGFSRERRFEGVEIVKEVVVCETCKLRIGG